MMSFSREEPLDFHLGIVEVSIDFWVLLCCSFVVWRWLMTAFGYFVFVCRELGILKDIGRSWRNSGKWPESGRIFRQVVGIRRRQLVRQEQLR